MIRISGRAWRAGLTALLCLGAGNVPASAGDLTLRGEVFDDPNYDFKIDTELTAGKLSGTSHELVYDARNGRTMSELIWTMDDVVVIGGKISLKPSHWWSVDMSGYINATNDSTMDDYDWFNPSSADWTDWSHHPDTSLERALMIDVSTKLALWRTDYFDLQGIAGYRWDTFDWTAYGGSYVYSSAHGFRDETGTFTPGSPGISYKQEYSTPYVGLGGQVRLGDLTVDGSVAASWWASMSDLDNHWVRYLEFQESFEDGTMLKYDIQARYQLTDSLALKGGWQHLDYDLMKGPTRMSVGPGGPGIAYYPGDAAGSDSVSDILSAGVVYTFQ